MANIFTAVNLTMGVSSTCAAEHSPLRLSFLPEGEWVFQGTGLHEGWIDRRNLFVLYHPWEVSLSDHSGTVSREIHIPADWKGRVRLHFYMTDDYHGQHPKLNQDNWLGQISLIGHRFKQVLMDDEVIWEADVADPEGVSVPSRFSVLLPERVKAGVRVQIGFRLNDKVGSSQRLPEDYRHIGATDGIKESEPWKFMTHVYIGNVTLTPEAVEEVEFSEPLSARLARQIHEKSWPLEPYGQAVTFPVPLTWEGSNDAPAMNCAIRCGVPLPSRMVHESNQIILRNKAGKCLPLQISPMNYWQDGSLRWVELDTIATTKDAAPGGKLQLDIDKNTAQTPLPQHPVSIHSEGRNKFTLATGAMRITVGGTDGRLLDRMVNEDAVFKDLTGEIEIGGRVYTTITDSAKVLANGPIRGEIELSGKMKSADDEIGKFVFRLSVFAGQPYVRMTWRIFNDQAETLNISRFELVGQCPMGAEAISRWGPGEKTAGPNVRVQQLTESKFNVIDDTGAMVDTGESVPGWLGVTDDQHSLVVLVRHFRQQFSKALELKDGRLRIALFEASEERPHYMPTEGEAKCHELWLGLWNQPLSAEEMTQTARFFARPGRLFNAEYFCDSGGFGYAAVHNTEQFADLDAYMKTAYGQIDEKRFYGFDIRHWGDQIYNKEEDFWCNGYYDRQQGFANEYLMTGDVRWFDRLEATVRHVMDIDVCHASTDHPDWVGSIHSYNGANHTTAGPWNAMQRTKGTLAYWRYTGDIDAKAAALGVADSAIRANRGIGATSVRDHAGILYCLMAAYDETYDAKYLEAAKRVAHDAIGRIIRGRGCYSEVHGNISYRSNVPWMVAQLAEPLYEYYRHSGDIDAAIAVVGLAESILTENCSRTVLGDVYGYSHNPHFKKTSGYHVLIAPAILYAYELTGDKWFLEHARAMYAQTILEKSVNAINNCYWNTPTLLYYLKRFGLAGENAISDC